MEKTGTDTEREAGNNQDFFGHADDRKTLPEWLATAYAKDSFSEKRFHAIAGAFLQGEPKQVLEIGAAVGDFSVYCSTLFPQHFYTVSDLAEKLLKNHFPQVVSYFHSQGNFHLDSFASEHIPYADNTYDIVFIKSAVHHFEKAQQSFAEIRRILKPGGKVVFFNDPVCLNIPVYKEIKKASFATEDRELGFNCKVHTFGEYMSYGKLFAKKEYIPDLIYLEEFKRNFARWTGLKKYAAKIVYANPFLFRNFMIYKFGIPYIFVFTK